MFILVTPATLIKCKQLSTCQCPRTSAIISLCSLYTKNRTGIRNIQHVPNPQRVIGVKSDFANFDVFLLTLWAADSLGLSKVNLIASNISG
jgi:hypothetical protein